MGDETENVVETPPVATAEVGEPQMSPFGSRQMGREMITLVKTCSASLQAYSPLARIKVAAA
jgi:hypothetical protein